MALVVYAALVVLSTPRLGEASRPSISRRFMTSMVLMELQNEKMRRTLYGQRSERKREFRP